jgi:hypothetical protein
MAFLKVDALQSSDNYHYTGSSLFYLVSLFAAVTVTKLRSQCILNLLDWCPKGCRFSHNHKQ